MKKRKKGKWAGRKIDLTETMQEVVNLLNGDDDDEESVKGRDARLEDMAKRLADETNNGDEWSTIQTVRWVKYNTDG